MQPLATRTIAALLSAFPLQEAPVPPRAIDSDAIDVAVERVLERERIPGAVVAVLVGREVVHRRSYGYRNLERDEPMKEDDLFQIGSATKTMTATLLVRLRDEGKLGLDDPLAKHLPAEVKLPAEVGRVTLRQLAMHTSGLPRNPVNRRNVPGTPSVAMPYSVRELYEGLASTALAHPAGERWDYSNLGYALLGHVLERASGRSYAELARTELWEPLGMRSTGIQPTAEQEARFATHYWDQDDPRVARERWHFGEVAGHGGVFSCIDDLARFLAFQIEPPEGSPLGRESLAEMREPVVSLGPDDDGRMALGWFVYVLPGDITLISHAGEVDGHTSSLAFLPREEIGLAVLANLGGTAAEDIAKDVLRALFRPPR